MKKTLIAAAVAGLFAIPSISFAADAAPAAAPASPHTFTANVGVVTDYLFRGISQTHGKPAIQGGVDYSHSSGLYAGTWLSSISWVGDFQGKSVPTEIDLYGGYKNTFAGGDWNYDVGVITYNYPGSGTQPGNLASPNTTEVYGSLGWKWISAKYSHTVSKNFVGWYGGANLNQDTRGSGYFEVNATYDLGNGWGVSGHVGHQKVKNSVKTAAGVEDASYSDWKIGVTKDIGFGVIGLAYSDTNTKGTCNSAGGTNAYCWGNTYGAAGNAPTANFTDVSKGTAVLSFTKSF